MVSPVSTRSSTINQFLPVPAAVASFKTLTEPLLFLLYYLTQTVSINLISNSLATIAAGTKPPLVTATMPLKVSI